MKYDDASWHYGGDFPRDLPDGAGATHTGMFLAWCLFNGLAGEDLAEEPEEIERLENRTVTPGRFFLEMCDGKFVDEDVNEEGQAFVEAYFDFEKGDYLSEYEGLLAVDLPTTYHAPDTWENYDRLAPVIERRYTAWKAEQHATDEK
ncbi:MAG: hypothetical protein HN849_32865 [Victivallales bacterium]|nr:hypothetical protein [Victivallales bacterium]MBT7304373.1 hypothetical protein [Victivallales bacterium]